MRKDEFSAAAEEINAALCELNNINEQLNNLSEDKLLTKAKAQTVELKNQIKSYLSLRGELFVKIAKLKSDFFVISGGRIIGRKQNFNIVPSAQNAEKIISDAKNAADMCLKSISSSGITLNVQVGIATALQALYAVYDSLEQINNEFFDSEKALADKSTLSLLAQKEATEKKLDLLQQNKSELLKLSTKACENAFLINREPQKQLADNIELPVAFKKTDGVYEFLYWNAVSDGPLVINYDGDIDETADFVRAVTLNFLYSYPGMNKQILYAADKDSDNINNFLRLLSESAGKEIFYLGKTSFRQPLGEFGSYEFISALRETVESRSSLLEKYGYKTVFEYNAANSDTVKPPVLVLLQDYPRGFKKSDSLDYFFKSGAKTGLFFVVIKTSAKSNDYVREQPADPALYSEFIIDATLNFEFDLNGERYEPLKIDSARAREAEKLIAADIEVSRSVLGYESIGFGNVSMEEGDNADVLSIPVGKSDGKTYEIKFAVSGSGSEPIGYVVIGKPKMGKSSFIDAMIMNGAMKYSPDDLQFCLIDFKDGVSSAAYARADLCAMPHIRLLAQSSRLEDAQIILSNIKKEKERRNEIFTNFPGGRIDNLAKYNARSQKHMPHIVVVVDEVHNVFKDSLDAASRKAADAICDLLGGFASEGRSEGIHLLIASQSVSPQIMNKVGSKLGGRVCFSPCSQSDAEYLVDREGAAIVINECNRAGYAVSHTFGTKSYEKICVAYHCSKETAYAAAVRKKWSDYVTAPIVVGDASPLYAADFAGDAFKTQGVIPIGESFYDHSVFGLTFGCGRCSLMAVGEVQDNDTAEDDLVTSLITGAVRSGVKVELLDATKERRVGKLFYGCNLVNIYDERDYLKVLSAAVKTLRERKDDARSSYQPILYIFHGLSRVTEFIENSGEKTRAAEQVDGMPEGYKSFSSHSLRQTESVRGADGLAELVEKNNLDVDLFVAATFSSVSSVGEFKYSFRKANYMVFTPSFVVQTEGISGGAYSHTQGLSCSKNLLLISENGGVAEKVRFFKYKYEDDQKTFEYIKKAVKK